jgi:hypothetical protein
MIVAHHGHVIHWSDYLRADASVHHMRQDRHNQIDRAVSELMQGGVSAGPRMQYETDTRSHVTQCCVQRRSEPGDECIGHDYAHRLLDGDQAGFFDRNQYVDARDDFGKRHAQGFGLGSQTHRATASFQQRIVEQAPVAF